MFVPSSARWFPGLTGTRAGNSKIGVSEAVLAGMVTVGPSATSDATAASSFAGSGRLTFASRNVTVAALPPSPNARIRNFVITPPTGAPAELGSPFGSVGWMNEAIVHGFGKLVHSPELAGSWFSRLPKVVAAWPTAGSASVPASTTASASGPRARAELRVMWKNLRHLGYGRTVRRLALALAVLAGLAVVPATAGAVFSGANGPIVFTSGRGGMPGIDSNAKIWMVGSEFGGTAFQLTTGDTRHSHPAWSPDRTKVAYARSVSGE